MAAAAKPPDRVVGGSGGTGKEAPRRQRNRSRPPPDTHLEQMCSRACKTTADAGTDDHRIRNVAGSLDGTLDDAAVQKRSVNMPTNYRGIDLTAQLSKCMESC